MMTNLHCHNTLCIVPRRCSEVCANKVTMMLGLKLLLQE